MDDQVLLRGRPIDGRGKAKTHVTEAFEEFKSVTGECLFPGSLNLVLDQPVLLDASAAKTCQNGERLLWPAKLLGKPVWLYRYPTMPLHVVEVLSSVKLRDALELVNDRDVELAVSKSLIRKLSVHRRIAWMQIWAGRRSWVYANDRYFYRTAQLGTELGATQSPRSRGFFSAYFQFLSRVIKNNLKGSGRSAY